MSNAKDIRTKISSITNTKKITRAMEMVAAGKMRKAQQRMQASRPFAHKILQVIHHLAKGHSEYHHHYLQHRETTERVGYIVVSSDRGLCGGLNINLFRAALADMRQWQEKGAKIELCLIGKKAEGFFKRIGGDVIGVADHLGDAPSIRELIGVVKIMLDAYEAKRIDKLYIVFNEFVNTMQQSPKIEQLLPLESTPDDNEALSHYWDYIYEPDAKELLDDLLTRYIESEVYQAVVENVACEQAARMIAMKSASDNAGDLIDELKTVYNKARQASITQEIAEIVGGAAAVE